MSQIRFRQIFWLVFTVVTLLALLPLEKPFVPLLTDKIKHTLAFFSLAILALRGWPGLPLFPGLAAYLLLYGLLIEMAQYFIPHRYFSGWDLMADATGIALCWLVGLLGRVPTGGRGQG